MIEIKKITDEALAQRLCLENGLEWADDYKVIATLDGKDALNLAVFTYDGEEGRILAIAGFEDDIFMLDGLCRAILNIMDINGVKQVYLSDKYEKLAKYVGFSKDNDDFVLKLEGFFECKCGKKGDEI